MPGDVVVGEYPRGRCGYLSVFEHGRIDDPAKWFSEPRALQELEVECRVQLVGAQVPSETFWVVDQSFSDEDSGWVVRVGDPAPAPIHLVNFVAVPMRMIRQGVHGRGHTMHTTLSKGQRDYDLELAATNVAGELMDLQAGELLHESIDPIATGLDLRLRYDRLWAALNEPISMEFGERHRLDERIRTLNSMGFDVAELTVTQEQGGTRVVVEPKVVDAGHHARRLLRLTGLDVEENQAQRLLNDLDAYRVELGLPHDDEEIVAHRWVTEVFEPVVSAVPRELRGKFEPAEVFHEVLEHRWFASENAQREIGLLEAADMYVRDVLTHKPDEQAVLGTRIGALSDDTAELRLVMPLEDTR